VSEATPSSDSSRFVYSEILSDETKETASTFMRHALNAFALLGVKVQRVLTDNGSCYRSRAFAEVLTEAGISHKRTRPYRPGTAPAFVDSGSQAAVSAGGLIVSYSIGVSLPRRRCRRRRCYVRSIHVVMANRSSCLVSHR
jgi:hypothetical protein